MKKEYIIPIFVPHLGCPNNCTFCNQKKISGQTKMVTAKDVTETIESFLQYMKDANADKEVAFYGGSFTAIEKEKQEEIKFPMSSLPLHLFFALLFPKLGGRHAHCFLEK